MVRLVSAVVTLLLTATASAAPVEVEERACFYTCGSNCYTQAQVTAAQNKGYSLKQSGSTLGGYPHQYNNYEGFSFPTAAPWYEFPILASHAIYAGASPGADRVIFDSKGALDKLITHTGASGNAFVACVKG